MPDAGNPNIKTCYEKKLLLLFATCCISGIAVSKEEKKYDCTINMADGGGEAKGGSVMAKNEKEALEKCDVKCKNQDIPKEDEDDKCGEVTGVEESKG